jgi:hypothetical protein
MQQTVSVLVVGFLVVGAMAGLRVGKARTSHNYYRRVKGSVPGLRKTAWADIRGAAGLVLLVAFLIVAVVIGLNAQS